jgi:hypothetical protein
MLSHIWRLYRLSILKKIVTFLIIKRVKILIPDIVDVWGKELKIMINGDGKKKIFEKIFIFSQF